MKKEKYFALLQDTKQNIYVIHFLQIVKAMAFDFELLLEKFKSGSTLKNRELTSLQNANLEESDNCRYNICLAFTYLAVDQFSTSAFAEFGQDDDSAKVKLTHAKNYLENLNFDLSDWNFARTRAQEEGLFWSNLNKEDWLIEKTLVPAKRNDKSLAIWDCIKLVCLSAAGPTWLINPMSLVKLPFFTQRAMYFSQYELGLADTLCRIEQENQKLAEEKAAAVEVEPVKTQQPVAKPELKKPFNKVVAAAKVNKKSIASKSEATGKNPIKIGIKPVRIGLHAKVLAGGSAEKLTSLLRRKCLKASNIKITNLHNCQKYSTYQIQLDISVEKQHFWKDDDFWPYGVWVRKWKGALTRGTHELFRRRLELTGIKKSIGKDRIQKHLTSRVYNGVEFVRLEISEVLDSRRLVDMQVPFAERDKVQLKSEEYPDGVKARWLKLSKLKRISTVEWC